MGHSALRLMRHGVSRMDLGHGVIGWGLNGGVALGSGYVLGQLYHRHSDKWYGKHAPRIAAAAGKIGAVALQLATGGPSIFSGVVDSLGQSGLTLMGCEWGLEHARQATGKKTIVVDKGRALSAGERQVRIGELPAASPGRAMDWDDVARMASLP